MQFLNHLLVVAGTRWRHLTEQVTDDRDRGDVPGWVMVTVMTAILVVAILGVFEPEIKSAISNAIDSVSNSGTQ
jgi:hypothetical protein